MKYKALVLDLDGTTVESKPHALPSKKVTEAIEKAKKQVKVVVATSRNYFETKPVLDHLKLKGPAIVSSGAQIIDETSGKILWEKRLDRQSLEKVLTIAQETGSVLHTNIEDTNKPVRFTEQLLDETPLGFFSHVMNEKDADILVAKLSHIATIAVYKVLSWSAPNLFVVIVNSNEATKQHGIFEVAKLLKIKTSEIIGVGDSYNDFPLLMACGLKIAMGNAAEELKAIADFVAPSVEEDGVAVVIEKFILDKVQSSK